MTKLLSKGLSSKLLSNPELLKTLLYNDVVIASLNANAGKEGINEEGIQKVIAKINGVIDTKQTELANSQDRQNVVREIARAVEFLIAFSLFPLMK